MKALFDADAVPFDAAYEESGVYGHMLRSRLAAALRLLGDGPGDVLDAGMGPGRLCAELDSRGWTVTGVDFSDEMVALARRRLPQASGRLVQARLENLPFPDASFDAVASLGVLEYVDNLQAALRELVRVLRPGGLAVVSNPYPRGVWGLTRRLVLYPLLRAGKRVLPLSRPVPPRIGRRRFEELLVSTGLRVEALAYSNFVVVITPLDRLLPRITVRLAGRLEDSSPTIGKWFATQLLLAARKDS